MTAASEATYFDGAHLAHVAAYEEQLRLERIRRENQRVARECEIASRRWDSLADRLTADHREFRGRLAVIAGGLA